MYITPELYQNISIELLEAIDGKCFWSGSIDKLVEDGWKFRATICAGWSADTLGSGQVEARIDDINAIWWEFRIFDDVGDELLNDFNFGELKKYIL